MYREPVSPIVSTTTRVRKGYDTLAAAKEAYFLPKDTQSWKVRATMPRCEILGLWQEIRAMSATEEGALDVVPSRNLRLAQVWVSQKKGNNAYTSTYPAS